MKFLDKRSKEIKNAYSIEMNNEKILVKFSKNGKIYAYSSSNIEIIDELQENVKNRVYQFKQPCYKCGQTTTVYTYIVFSDNENEDVIFPWDKKDYYGIRIYFYIFKIPVLNTMA